MKPKCTYCKYVLLILGILMAAASIVTVIFGYVVPLIQSSDYTLQSCKVVGQQTVQSGDYQGLATLSYLTLSASVEVVHSPSKVYVEAYLQTNYRVGSMVQCLVSSNDIRVSIFISSVGLAFTIVLAILGTLCIGTYFVIAITHKLKRSQYTNLGDVPT